MPPLRGGRRAQHAQRRRRDEGVAHLASGEQREGFLGIELLGLARHDRDAVMQARQQAVEQAARPRPIGRRPEPVAVLREEIVRHLHARQMPEHDAVPVQRTLRRPGGAGGEDHQRGIVRRGGGGCELIRRARDRLVQAERAIARAVDGENNRQVRQLLADLGKLREPLRVGDGGPHARVLQPVAQRIDTEQDRKRHRDRTELVDRDMPGGGFRCLRQQHRDAVAARDAVRCERVGEPVRFLAQPAERDVLDAVRAHVKDREPARIGVGPLVADIDADVVAGKLRPAEFAIKPVVVVDRWKHVEPGAREPNLLWT